MFKKTILGSIALFAFVSAAWGANNNTITYNATSDGGGGTLLTWTVTGGITSSGVGYSLGTPFAGFMVQAAGIFNTSTFTNNLVSITSPDGSFYRNVNTTATANINYYNAVHTAGTDTFGLACTGIATSGQTIQYVAGTQSADLAIPFSNFNVGSYTISYTPTTYISGTLIINLNVLTPVPEPSTWALIATGAAGLLALRRKK